MIRNFMDKEPCISDKAFVAENAALIGDVVVKNSASVWYSAVLRGDNERILIGEGSNIQDNCTVHVDDGYPVNIGEGVTVGHNVILHGCTVGKNSLIGMGSTILDGAVIGENVIIGAGSLVTSGKQIPDGVLCLGSPAKVIRELSQEEIDSIKESAKHYMEKAEKYTL